MNRICARSLVAAAALLGAAVLAACSNSSDTVGPQGAASGGGSGGTSSGAAASAVSTAKIIAAVRSAQTLSSLPDSLAVSLTAKQSDDFLTKPFGCHAVATVDNAELGNCAYGSPTAHRVMAIYGDSHAYMWAAALNEIALRAGWQLRIFGLSDCPVADLHFLSSETRTPSKVCDQFHTAAVKGIAALHPDVVFTTSTSVAETNPLASGALPTSGQWAAGWTSTLTKLRATGAKLAFLGDIPSWQQDGPDCLAAHLNNVQACAAPRASAVPAFADAERRAATVAHAVYIDPSRWVCAAKCEPVVDGKRVYNDQYHFLTTYTQYLSGAVQAAAASVLK